MRTCLCAADFEADLFENAKASRNNAFDLIVTQEIDGFQGLTRRGRGSLLAPRAGGQRVRGGVFEVRLKPSSVTQHRGHARVEKPSNASRRFGYHLASSYGGEDSELIKRGRVCAPAHSLGVATFDTVHCRKCRQRLTASQLFSPQTDRSQDRRRFAMTTFTKVGAEILVSGAQPGNQYFQQTAALDNASLSSSGERSGQSGWKRHRLFGQLINADGTLAVRSSRSMAPPMATSFPAMWRRCLVAALSSPTHRRSMPCIRLERIPMSMRLEQGCLPPARPAQPAQPSSSPTDKRCRSSR